jgi:AbrB family looped-hinge helix DNA binding protein
LAQAKTRRRVVKVQSKGQVTIPSEFREALGIGSETLLSITIAGDHLEITPLRQGDEALRSYTDSDISRFLEEDRLDEDTAQRVRDLLKRGDL